MAQRSRDGKGGLRMGGRMQERRGGRMRERGGGRMRERRVGTARPRSERRWECTSEPGGTILLRQRRCVGTGRYGSLHLLFQLQRTHKRWHKVGQFGIFCTCSLVKVHLGRCARLDDEGAVGIGKDAITGKKSVYTAIERHHHAKRTVRLRREKTETELIGLLANPFAGLPGKER